MSGSCGPGVRGGARLRSVTESEESQEEIEEVAGVVELEPEPSVLPAVSSGGALESPRPVAPASPAVQAAAVAATGLMAGAATVAAVRRVRTRGLPSSRRTRRWRKAAPIVTTRSFLVDVHLLDPRR